ncbi:DUF2487 family protein [Paenibacillus sp. HJL G12]|uniref:DUF2487 family protein n=1 Tax=Paenibacillus dendrobii TaxID=2691084 RepID=A0A7X3IJL4_9BACL|nr:DUF2487 family protein [Paenibacillus dendrobii]MWV44698.1 DUF2487 family protein [Paenibacillus dendrobii]
MKFSEVDEASWQELQPYFDTCLIPYTGLTGMENPMQATAALERLRDFMDLVEIPFKGRMITYPAFQYGLQQDLSLFNEICRNVKGTGFKHVVVMSADCMLREEELPEADLILSRLAMNEQEGKELTAAVQAKIQNLWNPAHLTQM